jgi:hypothetical protein
VTAGGLENVRGEGWVGTDGGRAVCIYRVGLHRRWVKAKLLHAERAARVRGEDGETQSVRSQEPMRMSRIEMRCSRA